MVALYEEQNHGEEYLPEAGSIDPANESESVTRLLAVTDAEGNPIAYVPETMGRAEAETHAALFAEAPRLLDLVRFAAEHLNENSHPGLLKAFQSYCNEVLDRVEDSVVIS